MEQGRSAAARFEVSISVSRGVFQVDVLVVFPVLGRNMEGRMEVVAGDQKSKSPPFASR